EVRDGHIRWVLTTSSGPGGFGAGGAPGTATGTSTGAGTATGGVLPRLPGAASAGSTRGAAGAGAAGGRDTRVGASRALSAVASACRRVSAVAGLYDCAGRLAAAAAG